MNDIRAEFYDLIKWRDERMKVVRWFSLQVLQEGIELSWREKDENWISYDNVNSSISQQKLKKGAGIMQKPVFWVDKSQQIT